MTAADAMRKEVFSVVVVDARANAGTRSCFDRCRTPSHFRLSCKPSFSYSDSLFVYKQQSHLCKYRSSACRLPCGYRRCRNKRYVSLSKHYLVYTLASRGKLSVMAWAGMYSCQQELVLQRLTTDATTRHRLTISDHVAHELSGCSDSLTSAPCI